MRKLCPTCNKPMDWDKEQKEWFCEEHGYFVDDYDPLDKENTEE